MLPYKINIFILIPIVGSLLIAWCSSVSTTTTEDPTSISQEDYNWSDFYVEDRTVDTHSNDTEPNFEEVFDDSQVKRIDITISPANRQIMQDNMTELYWERWNSEQQNPWIWAWWTPQWDRPQWLRPPREEGQWWNWWPWRGWGWAPQDIEENPIFVPGTVTYNDIQRSQVWVRFKWNSSLRSSRTSWNNKLPFKLDFDEFEDDYPELKNQRFYWFKQLSLKNNYLDPSLIREKVASDIFRDAWIPSAHTALYELYVDYGDSPIYYGVYTLVEEVDDTVIETQFTSGEWNLYKPDGVAATFAQWSFDAEWYDKQTNEDKEDFSDIEALLDALHAENRLTDPESRRNTVDSIFDTDHFLHYLAINTIIQNRDTYGAMTHNYFLYNNPETNLLTRIPWDNNESLQEWKRNWALPLDFSTLQSGERPLIEYLYADDTYRQIYEDYLIQTVSQNYNSESMEELYTSYEQLLASYADAEQDWYTFLNSQNAFEEAIQELKVHVQQRASVVNSYFQ